MHPNARRRLGIVTPHPPFGHLLPQGEKDRARRRPTKDIPPPRTLPYSPLIPASYAVPTQGRAGWIGWRGRSPAWVENFGAAWRRLERLRRKRSPDDRYQIQGSIDAPAAGPQRYRLCSGPPKQADAVTNGQWLVSLNVRIVGHWPFVTVHPIAERRSGALAYLR